MQRTIAHTCLTHRTALYLCAVALHLLALLPSCMACPTCTLAAVQKADKPDNTSLTLLALLLGRRNKKIWVTGIDYTGALGGIAGADAKCNNAADPSWPGYGTYKAMIVEGTTRQACTSANCSGGPSEHSDWVLQPNTTYYRADGLTEIFTSNANGVWNFADGQWAHHITDGPSNPQVWTGLDANWMNGSNCNNWTNGTIAAQGYQGVSTGYNITYTSDHDIYAYSQTCSDGSGNPNGRLYCVDQ